MKPVESSNLSHVGWDNGTLKVRFKNGAEWHYADVPPELHNQLMTADSIGSFFGRNIKGQFTGTKQQEKKDV